MQRAEKGGRSPKAEPKGRWPPTLTGLSPRTVNVLSTLAPHQPSIASDGYGTSSAIFAPSSDGFPSVSLLMETSEQWLASGMPQASSGAQSKNSVTGQPRKMRNSGQLGEKGLPPGGLEPPTSRLTALRSSQLSYGGNRFRTVKRLHTPYLALGNLRLCPLFQGI